MRILIATSFFPPDVEEPAPYVKELAARLMQAGHRVEVVLYGCLPERVEGVSLCAIDKRAPLAMRLVRYTRALIRAMRKADCCIIENGPSVELPLLVALLFVRTPYVVHEGDPRYRHALTTARGPARWFARAVRAHARDVRADTPPTRPEVLPFTPPSAEAYKEYEQAWTAHLTALITPSLHVDR